jgi:polynucleotide 5'-hydroxyl-kinase GRC3/NOL9
MKTVVLKGPCTVKSNGKASVMGIDFEQATLPEGTYTVCYEGELQHNCEALATDVQCWDLIARELATTSGKFVVLGPGDTGKSYFAKTLVNLGAAEVLVDADVGQNSLFLPGFIASVASSRVKGKLKFHHLTFEELKFFGSITPSTNPRLHAEQVSSLVRKSAVVDLDGWVHGFMAFRHKLETIELIDPDYVIVTDKRIAEAIMSLGKKVVSLETPPVVSKRDRERRRAFRAMAYRAYFMESKRHREDVSKIAGMRLAEGLFEAFGEAVETTGECLADYVVNVDRLYVGLTLNGRVIGAGLLTVKGDEAFVESPVNEFDGIILGTYRLNEFYEELPYSFRKCRE